MAARDITDGRCDIAPLQNGKTALVQFIHYDEATAGYSVSPGATRSYELESGIQYKLQ